MSIVQKIKDKLGIGGVKVLVSIPSQVAITSDCIEGSFKLTSKSDHELKSAEVIVYEEFTTGRGAEAKTKELNLGSISVAVPVTIKKGEELIHNFKVPFQIVKSNADELKEKGGALGKLGSLGKFAKNEKSAYFVKVKVDVKSAVLDPHDFKEVKFIQ